MAKKKRTSKKSPKVKAAKQTPKKKVTRKKTTVGAAASGKRAGKPHEELSIAVTFRRATDDMGLVAMGGQLNAETRKAFEPDEHTIGKAMAALTRHGFIVSSRGRYSVSIRGKRRDYEKLFGTKLSAVDVSGTDQGIAAASMAYFPAPGAPWTPDPGISQLIDDAYIQMPHIYMTQRFGPTPPSPLPPQVDYHHLRVPGDVALVLNAARCHRAGISGKGVRVAMIDSGFNHTLPYFQEMGYNSSVVLAPGATHVHQDGSSHGTGESANVFSIAPDVQFTGVKLDNESGGAGASVLEGLQEALKHNPQVISVSIGYDLVSDRTTRKHLTTLPNALKPLEAEIQAAVEDGIVIVFSAGNGHVAFPGMMPDVISAGGVYVGADGKMQASDYASAFKSKIYSGRHVPDFSGLVGLYANHADYIMLPIQPKSEIDENNSSHDGTKKDDGWGVFSGTSAAAPQLAGVCALLLQKDPSLTPSDIKQILRRTARDVVDGKARAASNEGVAMPAEPGSVDATGTGLVDAYAALQQV